MFASGKDRAIAGSELHTNFGLSAEGEYLALVAPDGTTIVHEYAPTFQPQLPLSLLQQGNGDSEPESGTPAPYRG